MKSETVRDIIGIAGGLVISIGVGALTGNLMALGTPANAGKLLKVCMKVGGYAAGGLAGTAASKQFERQVDVVHDVFKKCKEKIKKSTEKEEVLETEAE